jgi:site-specific DNA-methyltransferase (adenine-specific)
MKMINNPVIIGKATLYNADCMELLKATPDKFYELAIVDPPYGINVNHNMGRRRGNKASEYKPAVWDSSAPEKSYFDEIIRVSKNQIVWGANHFIDCLPYPSSCWVVWDKLFSQDVSFASAELAWTSFTSVTKKFTHSPADQFRIHPTQKPIKLYEWLLTNYAKQGDKILDTHGGSMSSVIACLNHGFEITCCELDTDYFEASIKRIEQASKQATLFEPKQVVKQEQGSFL